MWDRRRDVLPLGALFVLVALVVSLHVGSFKEISPIDELSHADTVIKASRFEMVRVGDTVGEVAMREEACRGFARPDDPIPPCDTEVLKPEFFQDLGRNTAASKFPLYHFLTGLPARAIRAVTPVDSLISAARLMGIAWLFGGVFVTWLIMGELGIRRAGRMVALGLFVTTPAVVHMSSIVNPDATLMFTGSSVVYVTMLWRRGRLDWTALVAVAAVAMVLETTNLVALAFVATYLIVSSVATTASRSRRPSIPDVAREMRAPALLVVAVVVVGVSYPAIHGVVILDNPRPSSPETDEAYALAYQPPEVESFSADDSVPLARILGEHDALITPIRRPFVPALLSGAGTSTTLSLLNLLLIGAGGAVLLGGGRSNLRLLVLAAAIVLVLTGPALAWDNARRDVFFAIPPRFGFPLLGVLGAALAHSIRSRGPLLIASALLVWATGNLVYKLVG